MSRHSLNYILLFCASVIILLLTAGCADDLRNRSVFDSGAGSAVIRFSVEKVSLTRGGEGRDMESVIDHAYLLFYDADDSFETAVPVAAVRADVDDADPGKLQFKMPLRLEPNTDYKLLAIANADGFMPSGFDSFGEYLDSWCRSSSDSGKELLLWRHDRILAANVDCLPMRGSVMDDSNFRFSMKDGAYSISSALSFRRMVARIDLSNNVSDGFVVEGVAICNWRDAVSVSQVESQLGNRAGAVCGVISEEGEDWGDDVFLDMPASGDDGIQWLKESIYCFPSVCYDSYPSDRESTALIIKAKYKDDAQSSYYRVNVGVSGNKSEVKANVKYLVNIRSVKGSGAPTAKEAYAAEESPILLTVVEDWDLEGSFAMDDEGNFIVLSSGRLEFDGESAESKEIKVLTSKNLPLNVHFAPDSEDSEDAFVSAFVSESPVSTLTITPAGKNKSDGILSGKFIVSASTPQGGLLSVDLYVYQNPAEGGGFEEPVIPDDMPFALIPQSYDRVKINHVNKTIEIDGFDPDCFNSFIDVPFKVYVNESLGSNVTVSISSDMEWPLEGRVSLDHSSQYLYCVDSFNVNGSVIDGVGNSVSYSTLWKSSISAKNEDNVYISVGAMGPDDPAIKRAIILSASDGSKVSYSLMIKPRPAIIDDVVLTDTDGSIWLIQDRNVQDVDKSEYSDRIGRDADGFKYQAYNYSYISINLKAITFNIPFKFKDQNNNPLSETMHELYYGLTGLFGSSSSIPAKKNEWLSKYVCADSDKAQSPFYTGNNYTQWILPSEDVFELMRQNIKISKMRMFIVSEIPIITNIENIPICCYLPYYLYDYKASDEFSRGFFSSADEININKILVITFDQKGVYKESSTSKNKTGMSRLVRPLTTEELEDYKTNYLGYGPHPHRLKICHPDTYESNPFGWLPY